MKSAFVILDGMGYRNLALGGVLDRASAAGETHVLHRLPESAVRRWKSRGGRVNWARVPADADAVGPVEVALQIALKYAHMRASGTRAHRWKTRLPLTGSWRGRAIKRTGRLLGSVATSPWGLGRLNAWHLALAARGAAVARYRRLLEGLRPDVLVFSNHVMEAFVAPVLAARSLGIPTVAFLASWDSLTTNERILAPFDHYLVWSRLMQQQLLDYYPHLDPARVHIVGTPQLDFHARQELLWPRREFFARIGADPGRPLICYSGAAARLNLDEPLHLKGLLDMIRSGVIRNRPQVVFRRNPWAWTRRHEDLRRDYPELLSSEPLWDAAEALDWTGMVPLADDLQLVTNLIHHADLNVNVASTMSIEFAMRDKPVVNIAFDVTDPPPFGLPLWDHFYQWEHYRPVWQLGAVRVARSMDDFATHINTYLEHPELDREPRRRLVEMELGVPSGDSGCRVVKVLQSIA